MSDHQKWAARWRARIKHAAWWLFWPAVAVVAWGQLTDAPPEDVTELFGWDKVMHFTAYFGLAWLATLAWGRQVRARWLLLGVLALGGAMEILQGLTGRDAEWGDMLANTMGALLGAGLALAMLWLAKLVDARRGD